MTTNNYFNKIQGQKMFQNISKVGYTLTLSNGKIVRVDVNPEEMRLYYVPNTSDFENRRYALQRITGLAVKDWRMED